MSRTGGDRCPYVVLLSNVILFSTLGTGAIRLGSGLWGSARITLSEALVNYRQNVLGVIPQPWLRGQDKGGFTGTRQRGNRHVSLGDLTTCVNALVCPPYYVCLSMKLPLYFCCGERENQRYGLVAPLPTQLEAICVQ